jgi:hypothetical protein
MKPIIFGIRKVYWIQEVPVYSPQEPSNNAGQTDCARPTRLLQSQKSRRYTPAFDLPVENLRPCSRFTAALVRREARYELVR